LNSSRKRKNSTPTIFLPQTRSGQRRGGRAASPENQYGGTIGGRRHQGTKTVFTSGSYSGPTKQLNGRWRSPVSIHCDPSLSAHQQPHTAAGLGRGPFCPANNPARSATQTFGGRRTSRLRPASQTSNQGPRSNLLKLSKLGGNGSYGRSRPPQDHSEPRNQKSCGRILPPSVPRDGNDADLFCGHEVRKVAGPANCEGPRKTDRK